MENSCSPGRRWWCLCWCLLCYPSFPLDVLDEIWDLIEAVSGGFLTYSFQWTHAILIKFKQIHLIYSDTQICSSAMHQCVMYSALCIGQASIRFHALHRNCKVNRKTMVRTTTSHPKNQSGKNAYACI